MYLWESFDVFKQIAISALCVASLSGCASFIAQGTGTTPVGLESGTRSLGQMFIDSSINRTAKINLYKLDSRFNQSRINIETFQGHVLLTGQVPDANLKQLAEDNLRSMSDVKSVHNYITVGSQIGYSTIMQDATITANMRGLLVKAPVVTQRKVHVHTENGVLYLMGRLTTAEIEDLRQVVQQMSGVNKIVTLIDNLEAQQQMTLSNLSNTHNQNIQPQVETPVAIEPTAAAFKNVQ